MHLIGCGCGLCRQTVEGASHVPYIIVMDQGFPVGGVDPFGGDIDLQCGHFSVKKYAKTKEFGPIGERCEPGTPPTSANDYCGIFTIFYSYFGK